MNEALKALEVQGIIDKFRADGSGEEIIRAALHAQGGEAIEPKEDQFKGRWQLGADGYYRPLYWNVETETWEPCASRTRLPQQPEGN